MKGSSQSQPSSRGTNSLATRKAKPSGLTKAATWFVARKASARLAPHALPEDTDVLIWTQAMEKLP